VCQVRQDSWQLGLGLANSPLASPGRHVAEGERGGSLITDVATTGQQPIRSTIPARLDRLRWSPFHTRLVPGLGTAWVLDGLSVTIASSVSSKLAETACECAGQQNPEWCQVGLHPDTHLFSRLVACRPWLVACRPSRLPCLISSSPGALPHPHHPFR
jgi:hypothetical protein